MRILIRFGDNDFSNTNMAFLRTLRDSFYYRPKALLTKEQIVKIYNEMIFGLYLLNQNQNQYKNETVSIKRYLKISVDRVHINDEIDEWVSKRGSMSNHDWFYLDVDNDQMERW